MLIAIFLFLSVLGIVAGGTISAFTARKPSRLSAWASAYLVLVVGIVQLGLIESWRALGSPRETITGVALVLYNLGNAGVILGTILKTKKGRSLPIVASGGALVGLAMVVLLYAVQSSRASWTLTGFVILTLVILISMPIGLVLSAKRRKRER